MYHTTYCITHQDVRTRQLNIAAAFKFAFATTTTPDAAFGMQGHTMRHISSMVWLTRLVVLGCICYSTLQNTAVAAAAAAEAASSNATLPSTLSRQGPSKICACAASTYDSKDCTAAVTAYCSGNSTADASFCSGMLDLGQLKTNQTAASMLVGFLATICKPAAGTVMDVCDCFKVRIDCKRACMLLQLHVSTDEALGHAM